LIDKGGSSLTYLISIDIYTYYGFVHIKAVKFLRFTFEVVNLVNIITHIDSGTNHKRPPHLPLSTYCVYAYGQTTFNNLNLFLQLYSMQYFI